MAFMWIPAIAHWSDHGQRPGIQTSRPLL